jgi:hypothetical protein
LVNLAKPESTAQSILRSFGEKKLLDSIHGEKLWRELESSRTWPGGAIVSTPSIAPTSGAGDIRERFQRLASDWKEQSRYLSNTAQMAMLKSYQRIIGMGWVGVPLILEELQREPDQWFWALEAITGENPVPPESAGKVRLMAQAWIEWGIRQGLLKA